MMAHSIQADAAKAQVLFAWIILKDQADYPGIFGSEGATVQKRTLAY